MPALHVTDIWLRKKKYAPSQDPKWKAFIFERARKAYLEDMSHPISYYSKLISDRILERFFEKRAKEKFYHDDHVIKT